MELVSAPYKWYFLPYEVNGTGGRIPPPPLPDFRLNLKLFLDPTEKNPQRLCEKFRKILTLKWPPNTQKLELLKN